MNPFQEIIDAKRAYELAIKAFGKEKFENMFKDFFEKHQHVRAVQWEQYAPYFNDGDPCIFSVHEGKLAMTQEFTNAHWDLFGDGDKDADQYDEETEFMDTVWDDENQDKEGLDIFNKAKYDLETILEISDVLKDVFGEDSLVTVTREGIEIDSCSHD